jgi:hypothetical protein
MSFRRSILLLSNVIVHCAGWLVPAEERREWIAEWQAELWHASARNSRQLLASSLGAFQDAYWIRHFHPVRNQRRAWRAGSASRCSLCLALAAAASVLLCCLLPSAGRAMRDAFRHDRDGIVMLARGGYAGSQSPTIDLEEYRFWKTNARRVYSDLAFYQTLQQTIHIPSDTERDRDLVVGRSSPDLFRVVEGGVHSAEYPVAAVGGIAPDKEYEARLFLTQTVFERDFAGNPEILGKVIEVAGRQALVAGLLGRAFSDLPGHADVWLVEDESQLAADSSHALGFVLARMHASGRYMTVLDENGGSERFECIPLAERDHLPFSIFVFTLIVAILALPATTPLPLGEYPRHGGHQPWAPRVQRWLFLWSKVLLVVLLVHFTAIDAAYGPTLSPVTAQYIQLSLSFLGFLFAFRWILQDQRRRCPVCLHVLSNPARVGEASRNFLAWNGTELICAGGHGLLHIPEHPTSWFETQRWLYLDASWRGLFQEGYVPHPGMI